MRYAGTPLLLFLFLCLSLCLLFPTAAFSCFGTELKVGYVKGDESHSYASFATGFYVEEKTGVAPRFIEVSEPAKALSEEKIDLYLQAGNNPPPEGVITREGGEITGLGKVTFWLSDDVLDDLRFTTVERALAKLPSFFSSISFIENAASESTPKKAARKAVLESD